MRKLFLLVLIIMILAGCRTDPEIIDDGNPGLIKIITYLDENKNQAVDQGEGMISDHVGISQDVSCPAGSSEAYLIIDYTDDNGEIIVEGLEPGIYCVEYLGDKPTTTKLTHEIPLNSGQEIKVFFGILE